MNVLFHLPDIEIASFTQEKGLSMKIMDKIIFELKYFLFLTPIDNYILITPSILFESHEFMKRLSKEFRECIEKRYIRLFTNQPDLKTLIEAEQESNKLVRYNARFKNYFYPDKSIYTLDMSFQLRKTTNVGEQSLKKCSDHIKIFEQTNKLSVWQANELYTFQKLISESVYSKNAFVWPLVIKHMEQSKLSSSIIRSLDFRRKMSLSYLDILSKADVIIPSDESFSNYPINLSEKIYNVWRLERLFDCLEINSIIATASESKLLKWKKDIDIINFCSDLRNCLSDYDSVSDIVNYIIKKHDIFSMFHKTGSAIMSNKKEITDLTKKPVGILKSILLAFIALVLVLGVVYILSRLNLGIIWLVSIIVLFISTLLVLLLISISPSLISEKTFTRNIDNIMKRLSIIRLMKLWLKLFRDKNDISRIEHDRKND